MLPKQEPSLSLRKLKPPFESPRVLTQPFTVASLPPVSARGPAATEMASIVVASSRLPTLRQPLNPGRPARCVRDDDHRGRSRSEGRREYAILSDQQTSPG